MDKSSGIESYEKSRGKEDLVKARSSLACALSKELSVLAETQATGEKGAEYVLRKVSGEFEISIRIGMNIAITLSDLHAGKIREDIVGMQSLVSGWSWFNKYGGGTSMDEAGTAAHILELVAESFLKLEQISSEVFGDSFHFQRYLLAKLVCVRDARRFVELMSRVNLNFPHMPETIAGIILLHGGEIEVAMKAWMASKMLVG